MQIFPNLKLVSHCKTSFKHIIISFFRKYFVFCSHNMNKATKMIKLFRKGFSLNAKRSHHIPMISIKYLSVQGKKDLVQAHACACQSSNQMSAEGESCWSQTGDLVSVQLQQWSQEAQEHSSWNCCFPLSENDTWCLS